MDNESAEKTLAIQGLYLGIKPHSDTLLQCMKERKKTQTSDSWSEAKDFFWLMLTPIWDSKKLLSLGQLCYCKVIFQSMKAKFLFS